MLDLSKETADGVRNRLALKIVLGLVVAGVSIGLLVGFAGASAIRALGFSADDSPAPATSSPTSDEESDEPEDDPTAEPTTSPTTSPPTKKPKEARFEASSDSISPGERLELTGRAPKLGAGSTLQIQRREQGNGGWSDFPVTVQTNKGGRFSTWIVTSRTGTWDFRVVGDGFTSPLARVEIG